MNAARSAAQKKTFTRWVNVHLFDRGLRIEDIEVDLGDGIMLCNLMEIISNKKIKRWNTKPRMIVHKLENLNKALTFIQSEGIKIVNIGANDIIDGNLKIILGLIWTLILRYQINKGGDSKGAKAELLEWVNKQIAPYHIKAKNFTTDWQAPALLTALVDSLKPGSMDVKNVVKSHADSGPRTQALQNAMETAEALHAVPMVMDACDMADTPDDLSCMTYVSYFRDVADAMGQSKLSNDESYAAGPGLEGGVHNDTQSLPFTVFALDQDRKPLTADDCVCTVEVLDPQGKPCEVTIQPSQGPGSHAVAWKPKEPGQYRVNVLLDGQPIKDMPCAVTITRGADGNRISRCKFRFTIAARDADGQLETEGGDLFQVFIANERGELLDVQTLDNGDGSYTAKYALVTGQAYQVSAKLNGDHMPCSPFCQDLTGRAG